MLFMTTKFLNEIINPEIKFIVDRTAQANYVVRLARDQYVRNVSSRSIRDPILVTPQ